MSGIQQEPGFDTSVETFVPFRSAPVYRRVERKYHCQENLNGTSEFNQLTFKIHQPNENLVINECRLVLPLRLNVIDKYNDWMKLAVVDGQTTCNIAVSENPFSAFKVIDTAINGKVYTEEPSRYGNMLSACYTSVSEMGWQNNHSLKPIANLNRSGNMDMTRTFDVIGDNAGHGATEPDYGPTGDYVEVSTLQVDDSAFVAEQLNSGFLERSRAFQQGLWKGGDEWRGNISTLLNTALWSNESRGQGNIQIPYVEDLFMRFVFQTQQCGFDTTFGASSGAARYTRIIPQLLFEFLTPANMQMYRETRKMDLPFADRILLEWTGDPYLQIEWVQYQEMAPIYRLRGYRYQLVKSQEEQLLMEWSQGNIEERPYKPVRVLQECLAVPNKVYCWGELSEASARNAWMWGGMFRTCDLRNINVRVNGHAHIIQDPDAQSMVYKWFKRNTNSTNEYPVWNKRKIFVFTPTEIGLNSWLENDAQLSTLEISAEMGLSTLQAVEYLTVNYSDVLAQGGYSNTHNQWQSITQIPNSNANPPNVQFGFSPMIQDGEIFPEHGTRIGMTMHSEIPVRENINGAPACLCVQGPIDRIFGGSNFRARGGLQGDVFRLSYVNECYVIYKNCVWARVATDGTIVGDNFWFVPESYCFQYENTAGNSHGINFVPWSTMTWHPTTAHFTQAATVAELTSQGYIQRASLSAADNHTFPLYNLNAADPNPHGDNQGLCCPGPSAFRIRLGDPSGGEVDMGVLAGARQANEGAYLGCENADGTRWIVMGQPGTFDSHPQEWVTRYRFVQQDDQWVAADESIVQNNMLWTVQRNILGSTSASYRAVQVAYEFHPAKISDGEHHLKYELNVLLEYSNSQVLMSKTRDIPIHVSNLVPV